MADPSEEYRQQAREIAELAEKAEDPAVRSELFTLADRFRRLADYVADRIRDAHSFRLLGLGIVRNNHFH